MKSKITLILCFIISISSFSQERFLQYKSKDTIDGNPRVEGSLGVNLKVNGYYDLFGGLQDNETFNVGAINVFGTDDSQSLGIDLYQTQVKMQSNFITKKGENIFAMVEFDFWGGNGKMRLRKAYIETDHFLVGQTFVPYGDNDIWPNIFEWEGPPSGIWVRQPMVKYFNQFNNKSWHYTIALNAPITDYDRFGEIEPLIEEANQNTPDFTLAFKYEKNWGHLRLASILRNIQYQYEGEKGNFMGSGLAFSGIYKKYMNNFQFQLTGGKGVSAYNTSVQGFGYDGYPNENGNVVAMPSYGGWASYEFYYTPKFYSTLVIGYTRFFSDDTNRFIIVDEPTDETVLINGNIDNYHYYGILNFMHDPMERMTIGIEMDYGFKKLSFDGAADNQYVDDQQARDAMRISFGLVYYF
jgi:hypothetical protein